MICDELNDITFKLEKVFPASGSPNVNVIKAKLMPVVLGASFFGPNGEITKDSA